MAIGERIRFFRHLRGMTLKALGLAVGFSPRTAEVRMSQYEKGLRTPKADLIENLAYRLQVSTDALNVPDIDTYQGFMHTLFAIGCKSESWMENCVCILIALRPG